MRSWKTAVTALALTVLAPATALAQFGNTPNPGASVLTGSGAEQFNAGRMFTPQIDFLRFDSLNRDRWYPSFSYDGGRTFTRDPGAFSGRRDRAHAARVMTAEQFRRAQALGNWEPGVGVIIVSGQTEGAVGMTYGVFRDGRWVMAEGSAGQINLDVFRASGALSGNLQANLTDGLMAQGHAETRLTLIGINGQTTTGRLGNSNLGVDIAAQGRADVTAEATADGVLALGPQGLRGRLSGEAFAGARAGGEIPVGFSLLGVRFSATGRGQVSAGAGINGRAHAQLGNGGLTLGCDAGACLGVGGGVGADLGIDASVAINNVTDFFDNIGSSGPRMVREDFRPRIIGPAGNGMVRVSTTNCIGSRCVQLWSQEAADRLRNEDENRYQNLSAFFANPPAGNQARRYAPTTMSDADRRLLLQFITNPGPAQGAGNANALGRR